MVGDLTTYAFSLALIGNLEQSFSSARLCLTSLLLPAVYGPVHGGGRDRPAPWAVRCRVSTARAAAASHGNAWALPPHPARRDTALALHMAAAWGDLAEPWEPWQPAHSWATLVPLSVVRSVASGVACLHNLLTMLSVMDSSPAPWNSSLHGV